MVHILIAYDLSSHQNNLPCPVGETALIDFTFNCIVYIYLKYYYYSIYIYIYIKSYIFQICF